MKLRDEQWLRILECIELRVDALEHKRAAIDTEIEADVHELRGIMNSISLELQKRRLKS